MARKESELLRERNLSARRLEGGSCLILNAFAGFLVFLVIIQPLAAQEVPGWNLVWSDEFSQADGSVPDPSKWGYDIGGSGWGNNEIQYYTNRAENARIEGGELVIEAREESFGGRNHTSARLLTKGKWDWTYGRFEARVKVPSGSGLWPACWMLGANIDTVGWPNCGEIDIMEYVGRMPYEVFGTIHGPGYSGGNAVGGIQGFETDVADDYHVFVVEWDEDLIRWYVDGINYFSATPDSLDGDTWVFDHDHFIILNLAIGGNFGGTLDPNLSFPRRMMVDYVRVYERAEGGGSNVLANPGFENGSLAPWVGYSLDGVNAQGGYIESASNSYYNGDNPGGDPVEIRSGLQVAKVFGDFDGGENYNGFFQDVSVTPGSAWNADGWALTHPQDLMSGANEAWIELSFRDDSDTLLSVFRSEVLTTSNLSPGGWVSLQVTRELNPVTFAPVATVTELVAPAGATKARMQVVYRQPLYGGGSMYFDDLSLVEQTVPPPFRASLRSGKVVSWPSGGASSSYQPQQSNDQSSWTNIGPALEGDSVNSLFDGDGASFYQVVETVPDMIINGVANPGFETTEIPSHPSPGAPGWRIRSEPDTDPSNGSASMSVESSYASYLPNSGSEMLVFESTTPASPASVSTPVTNVRSDQIAVSGNTDYEISFHAAHVMKQGGANPQYNLRFFNSGMSEIEELGFESFSSIGSSWTKVSESFTTPAAAEWMTIEWIQALGAGNDGHWVTLIDDVEMAVGEVVGGQNILQASAVPGIELSWQAESGYEYQVESGPRPDSLTETGPRYTGRGSSAAYFEPITNERRFYRVRKLLAP